MALCRTAKRPCAFMTGVHGVQCGYPGCAVAVRPVSPKDVCRIHWKEEKQKGKICLWVIVVHEVRDNSYPNQGSWNHKVKTRDERNYSQN